MSMVCKTDFSDPWRTILDLILTQNREYPDPEHLKLITNHLTAVFFLKLVQCQPRQNHEM